MPMPSRMHDRGKSGAGHAGTGPVGPETVAAASWSWMRGGLRCALLCSVLGVAQAGAQSPDTAARPRALDAEAAAAKRALVQARETLGPRHPDTLTGMNNLAFLYERQGRPDEAELLRAEALRLRREVLGPGHPDTLRGMNDLGRLYQRQGRYAEAEPLLGEALRLRRKALGSDHPDTLASMNDLAALYQAQNRSSEAEVLRREASRLGREGAGRPASGTPR